MFETGAVVKGSLGCAPVNHFLHSCLIYVLLFFYFVSYNFLSFFYCCFGPSAAASCSAAPVFLLYQVELQDFPHADDGSDTRTRARTRTTVSSFPLVRVR